MMLFMNINTLYTSIIIIFFPYKIAKWNLESNEFDYLILFIGLNLILDDLFIDFGEPFITFTFFYTKQYYIS